ncbi:MAG: DUF4954 family protein [Prevotellaceae bacterium]|jgi:hypothetical protein|nr:DUF4954 family protein [Prevotellaceae bacterium]
MTEYRNITPAEVEVLQQNGCSCGDWSRVRVKDGFAPDSVRNVSFSGEVFLGVFRRQLACAGGVVKRSGIYNAAIHSCVVEDDVYINRVKDYIANYRIGKNVTIECVDTLAVTGVSAFGNGTCVAVLNETGGREIPIFNELSAHTAYLIAFYRHRPALIARLKQLIDGYTQGVRSDVGVIEEGAHISGCRTILNVNVGAYAKLEGACRLSNGSINSSKKDPAYVGDGVSAENFILSSGSSVSGASLISACFVGQGTVLGKQYSAENSVFFANCQGFHGEACSIFAGPYTVSHHKSTLLIATYCAFLNAGSGSNQSNHMYKLGPIHQGIIERGSKTASDSYILWPAKIGAFSLVMGRHYRNFDTSDFPFSYLIENTDESFLAPAVNLRSIGAVRDAQKWPQRDRRKDDRLLDSIVFDLLSPYSVQKMVKACRILEDLKRISGQTSEHYMFNSAKITHRALERGLHLYGLGITKFLGNELVKMLEASEFLSEAELRLALAPKSAGGAGEWIDMAGLPAPKDEVLAMIEKVENGSITSLREMNDIFREWKNSYSLWTWSWVAARLKTEKGIDVETVTACQLEQLVEEWKNAVVALDKMMYKDAQKEFTLKSQVSFGIDGEDDDVRLSDFENVRGEFTEHPAVKGILKHIEEKSALAEKVKSKLQKIIQT